ncbi:hypothetical protein CRV08_05265 [Halarcobacter ebronensis]|uniref:Uncharacterized protein n=1 Tax=Halarcobacter ebronensis TaxID=1462615 RepID=A0A4V1LRN8_9BACT|nr:hypothetical protein [Halarcobacter ebronensis]RXJ68848.1 hypothetical protein CRV08_05265 [Halarcobacter ebronensis]
MLNKSILQFMLYYILVLVVLFICAILFDLKSGDIDPLFFNVVAIYFILKYVIAKFYEKNERGLEKKEKSKFILMTFSFVILVQILLHIVTNGTFGAIVKNTETTIIFAIYLLINYITISFSIKYINEDYEKFVCPSCNKDYIMKESKEGYCTLCNEVELVRKK